MHTKLNLDLITNAPCLAQVLHHCKLLTESQLIDAILQAKENNLTLLNYLISHSSLNSIIVSKACAQYFNLPHRELHEINTATLPLNTISDTFLQKHHILPLTQVKQQLHVAIADPDNLLWLEEIQSQTGLHIHAIIVPYDQLYALINRIVSTKNYQAIAAEQSLANSLTPAVTFVEQILTDAIHRQASDIHCEPLLNHYRVRMRIDGLLHEITQAPAQLVSPITCRLKVMAQCDIAERRLPQDGRFTFTTLNGLTRDCRLSSCPTVFGEKIVIRLLDANKKLLNMDELGLDPADQQVLIAALAQPQGLILVTGPTGSGKTITLYTALQHLNRKTHNISTVEEPVEIQLPGINQVNIHEKAGLTFANVLRAFLRQDPDIIMVGEIRDKETADIAVRAAQTGHLVLSTLHTNCAASTLIRLINIGIAPFNVASSIRLIVAQRLVRKCCPYCHSNSKPGCHYCLQGYHGRMGIFSLMPISKTLSSIILERGAEADLGKQAEQEGMKTLWQAAMLKIEQGQTRLEEVHRVIEHE